MWIRVQHFCSLLLGNRSRTLTAQVPQRGDPVGLGVTQDRGLTWKPNIDQVRRKASQRFCIPEAPSELVKQPIDREWHDSLQAAMMDDACPIWWHVSLNHLKSLQVIQPNCLGSATGAPWYISNLQILSDLHIVLTLRFPMQRTL